MRHKRTWNARGLNRPSQPVRNIHAGIGRDADSHHFIHRVLLAIHRVLLADGNRYCTLIHGFIVGGEVFVLPRGLALVVGLRKQLGQKCEFPALRTG